MHCTACALFAKPYLIKFSLGGTNEGRTEGDGWSSNCELRPSAALQCSPVGKLPAHAAGDDICTGTQSNCFTPVICHTIVSIRMRASMGCERSV
jgi:hypothetical protein